MIWHVKLMPFIIIKWLSYISSFAKKDAHTPYASLPHIEPFLCQGVPVEIHRGNHSLSPEWQPHCTQGHEMEQINHLGKKEVLEAGIPWRRTAFLESFFLFLKSFLLFSRGRSHRGRLPVPTLMIICPLN